MQRYNDNILARSGGYVIPAAGASVTVKNYPAGTVATIYSDDGVTPKTNPIVTGSEGEFFFYAADGRYSLEISGGGYTGGNVVDITLDGLGDSDVDTLRADLASTASGKGDALLGHLGTGIGATPTAVNAELDIHNQKPTGVFFREDGAKVQRFNDRVFIGGATKDSGNNSQSLSESWMYQEFGGYWLGRGAQLFVATDANGSFGATFAAKTDDVDVLSNIAIGSLHFCWNNKVGTNIGWGQYVEAVRNAGAGVTYGQEIAVKNKGDNHDRTPYAGGSGGGLGTWYAGGGDNTYGGASANPCNAAIVIGKSSNTWNNGIVFDADGLTGSDGVTGTAAAIRMARGHQIEWFAGAANRTALIRSDGNDIGSVQKSMIFKDTKLSFEANGATDLFAFDFGVAAANGLNFTASASGGGKASIYAVGADANIDIELAPKSGGVLRYALPFNANADAPITGFMYIKDNAGTLRKLACIA